MSDETAEIANCAIRFRFECPKRWAELTPTGDSRIRKCGFYELEVHYCETREEALDKARQGLCVADASSDTLGILDPFQFAGYVNRELKSSLVEDPSRPPLPRLRYTPKGETGR
jgi:hypothetical protein